MSRFVDGFQRATRSRPQLVEAQVYDGARLIGALLEGHHAGGGGVRPTTRDELRRALMEVKDFPGVTGLIRFDDSGDSRTPLFFFQVDDDKLERVERDALAKAQGLSLIHI